MRCSTPRGRGPLVTAAVTAAVLTLGACGTDAAEDDGPVAEGADEEVVEDPSDDGAPIDPEVTVRDSEFDPATMVVAAGTSVTWTNEDAVEHTVTSGSAEEPDGVFDEPLAAEGGTVELVLDEPGTIVYHCTIHPRMTGRIEVE